MEGNTKKIIQALTYLASKQPDKKLGFMKAYKLLWLADRYHLRQYGRTVSGDSYYAMQYGMVPTDAKHLLDGEGTILNTPEDYLGLYIKVLPNHHFKAIQDPDMMEFSVSDQEVLDKIHEVYGGMSANDLSSISHGFPEWKAYEKLIKSVGTKSSYPVNPDLFFEKTESDESGLFSNDSEELLSLTKELFHQYNRV